MRLSPKLKIGGHNLQKNKGRNKKILETRRNSDDDTTDIVGKISTRKMQ
jgi:hypothetical protein